MKLKSFFLIVLAFSLAFLSSYGQKTGKNKNKIIISGKVTGADNKPVTDAFIFIDTTATGKTTDDMGKFMVKTSVDSKIISVASPDKGYMEKPIDGNQIFNFVLSGRKEELPGFVARYLASKTIHGNSGSKRDNSYYPDIYEMIRAKLPGVLVTGKSIVIQQPNSFFGTTTPLYIVNGVRVSTIDYINPVEVKSIELLTGSQSSIYGVEAANGVIVITLVTGADK